MLNKIGTSITDMIPDPEFDLKIHDVGHIKKVVTEKLKNSIFQLTLALHLTWSIIITNSEEFKIIQKESKNSVPQYGIFIKSKHFLKIVELTHPLLNRFFIITFIEIIDDVLSPIEGKVEFV